jgi:hypothetical protein
MGSQELADRCAQWAQREGILERVTEEQFADIAKAFMAGYAYGMHLNQG